MSQLEFDETFSTYLEQLYTRRDARRRRALVGEALAAQDGEKILDVGCGPGFYLAEILERVGSAGAVTGIDPAPAMLAIAGRRLEGHGNAALDSGEATALPVPDGAFDAAISVQVMEYVADVPAALAEIHRALRPGGRVVIWDVDWGTVSWFSGDQARMRRLLDAWDRHLAHPGLPQVLGAQLRATGFEDVVATGHAFTTAVLDPETYGGSLTELTVQYAVDKGGLDPADGEAWKAEQEALGAAGGFYFTCVQACFTATKPA